ncbi:MAG: mevalonate kinase [Coxiella sp. RIFCSPHIGHO2_12_FULL_44_14]|nr:MAG: mevalonate kinase [Coxiella sp. RIFCSPHIGHO2_12_FULL_44_14]
MNKEFLTVQTPGKLILSGEHAVLHGHPALAMAVNRYMQATARWTSPFHFSFNLMGIHFKQRATLHALRKLKTRLVEKYHQHQLGFLSIREVLQKPFELSLFTAINVLDRLKNKLPMGLDIATESNIPIGCGMGSSAASVVSIVYALTQFLDMNVTLDDYIKLGIESENLQHGHSSGLDVHTVYHGGCIRYENGSGHARSIPQFPMMVVQTGRPYSNTGECVAHTAAYFKNGSMGRDFAAITNALEQALTAQTLPAIQECIRHNQCLLNHIGVVPAKVNAFISEVEKRGAAAKICGAGSIAGDRAGIVLVVAEAEIDITAIVQQYGYTSMIVHSDTRGTHVI